jgi:hypothetical protein
MSISKFTGFKTYKSPTFTVTCPHSGFQYEVRSLNVGEITRIKESLITSNRLTETILDITWTVIDKDSLPEQVKNKEDFERFTTTNDRSAIIYGIYYITFGDSKEYELTCGFCSHAFPSKINYADFFSMNSYPYAKNVIESYKVSKVNNVVDEDPELENILEENTIDGVLEKFEGLIPVKDMPIGLAQADTNYNDFFEFYNKEGSDLKLDYNSVVYKLHDIRLAKESNPVEVAATPDKDSEFYKNDAFTKRVEVILPESGVLAIIKAPTIHDERILHNRLTHTNEDQLSIASDILFIDRFEEYEAGKTSPIQVISDQTDILSAYYSLPIDDRKELIDVYEREFGQYGVELTIKWTCQNMYCKEKNELEVDIINQFFRTVAASR